MNTIHFLGTTLQVLIVENPQKTDITLDQSTLVISTPYPPHTKKSTLFCHHQIKQWLLYQASCILNERLQFCIHNFDLPSPQSISIKPLRSKWGSCSQKNDITLNAYLIATPLEVIDYVCVHELVHILHFSHNYAFYAVIKACIPTYKKHEKWLKSNAHLTRSHSL